MSSIATTSATSTSSITSPSSSASSSGTSFTVPLVRVNKPSAIIETSRLLYGSLGSKLELENANEYAYVLSISVGEQVFEVILDTGSSDLWIVTTACTDSDCAGVARYSPSPTLHLSNNTFDLSYLTGDVIGTIGDEMVLFGPFVIFSQVLAFANSTTNMGLSATGVSGILGLAFPSNAAISSTLGRTLLENVFGHLEPADQSFSYKLSSEGNESTFSIGEINPAYADQASDIFYSPVYSSDESIYDYWKLPLQAMTVNGVSLPFALSPSKVGGASSPIAVLDTGTTLILGPTHDVDNFWAIVGGAQKGDDGRWMVRCNHVISAGFVLGNDTVHREFPLDPSDVSWWPPGSTSDGWCLGGVQCNDGVYSGDWLLGDIFLRSVYVVHHAETSSSPPLIGLLSTTNATQAAIEFQDARGADPTPVAYAGQAIHTRHKLPTGAILALALVAGFLTSAVLTVLFRMQREKGWYRRKMANLIHSKT